MKYVIPQNIILHNSKEIIFYIPADDSYTINIDLWKRELNLFGYKGLVIRSKCIFNRLKYDDDLGKN